MEKVKIFGDSTCDLPKEILERFDLDVMPLPVMIGDRQCLDGVDATRRTFTNIMRPQAR